MGFGALFAGHVHPAVRAAVEAQLDDGTLYVTPGELDVDVAELLAARFPLPVWRFTSSGTEATMDGIRLARGHGRDRIVKVEGGYHGHHDEVMISMKPALDSAGPADPPIGVPGTAGITGAVLADTVVIAYNDPAALERVLAAGDVACFIVEPVMENIGGCLPDTGYLPAVREITQRDGTMLMPASAGRRDTSGCSPISSRWRSRSAAGPGRCPRWRQDLMDLITAGTVLHLGTDNGNPLVMAAAKAVLTDACAAGPDCRGDRPQRPAGSTLPDRRAQRAPGAHRPLRRQGEHHLVDEPGAQLPRRQGHRLRRRVRPVDPRHQPRVSCSHRAATSSG
jgi:glutamate-1-semialdehyde 2,1-aminomutase